MARVTVTIEGDEREVGRVLRRLMRPGLGRRGCGPPGPGRGAGPEDRPAWRGAEDAAAGPERRPEGVPSPEAERRRHRHGGGGRRGWWAELEGLTPWADEELRALWREVTDGARKVLAELARRPEGYSNIELQQVLGMPGNAVGGTLSSVGVAARKFGPKPPIYFFRWETYRMLPNVAAAFARLAGETSGGGGEAGK